MSDNWRDAREWARIFLESNPSASIDMLCREAAAADVPLTKDLAAQERRAFRQRDLQGIFREGQDVPPVSLVVRCERCGGSHWISQCDVPQSLPVFEEEGRAPEHADPTELEESGDLPLVDPVDVVPVEEEPMPVPELQVPVERTVDLALDEIATKLAEVMREFNLSDVSLLTDQGSIVWDYEIRVRRSGKKLIGG